jgi:membrane-bound lytic murein transglycosylase B
MDRRALLTGISLSLALPRFGRAADFSGFLAALRARAVAEGIPRSIVTRTTAGLRPNAQVLKLDQHQPEFTETWAEYSSHVLSATRIKAGREKVAEVGSLLAAMTSRFGVAASALLGIWGIETNYGVSQGDFDVIDALTTLAWSRSSRFFAGQAISAMRIIARGDAPASSLTGSYAGAMGQPQFMPSVYLSTAVSFAGNGAPDIWNSDADSLASMANYLAKAGWQPGLPSSEPVLAAGIDPAGTGRENMRSLGAWRQIGVQRLPDAADLPEDTPAALLLPDGADGQAFLVYANFNVIRRYNASDYYALAVGALGRTVRNAA